ncbi:MAG: hypothetical protein R2867_33955 [Caldilineaceae bacterium]
MAACGAPAAPEATDAGSGEAAAPAAGEMVGDDQQIVRFPW